jgi:GrpB-like predicted nucleotidyltransferase (UPF0157 family)
MAGHLDCGNVTPPAPDIDEPIVIVPYDPSWPAQFDEETAPHRTCPG